MALPNTAVYFIENVGTKTVVDLDKGSPTDGTKVQGYKKRELSDVWSPAQLWILSKITTGAITVYTAENTNSRTYLTLNNGANGTPVLGYAGNNADSQKWVITPSPKVANAYTIRNKATGTYLDLAGGPVPKIQGWAGDPNTDNKNQLWYFVAA